MELSSRALKIMQYLVGALMFLTITLLVWQHYGMERVIELSPRGAFPYAVFNDDKDGGASIVSADIRDDALVVNCTLVRQFEWPYCSVRFSLGTPTRGMDLSDFDTVVLDVRHTGPGPHTLRMYLRNFEPGRASTQELNSQRVNEIEFETPVHGGLNVPISLLHTATWWAKLRNVALHDSAVRIDNVTTVELSSGVANELGHHVFEVRSIKFYGKWISQKTLLMVLVAAWFMCGVAWPLMGALHLRSQLRAKEARLAMLDALNQALQLEARELAGQAYTDPLTGALNRQGLRDALVKQWQTAPHGTSAIIFMDLDHFKPINDNQGHPVGDDVLRRFAAMIRADIRASDKLVRWGGEEFLIVCPDTSAVHAQQLAEKLRQSMPQQAWPNGLRVTASFGVTELGKDEDIGEAIKRADDALYRAKHRGRNCVEVAYRGARPDLQAA
ncbi:MAG: GGDEF domain-containing protein [Gammaproteobacteria bacterium]